MHRALALAILLALAGCSSAGPDPQRLREAIVAHFTSEWGEVPTPEECRTAWANLDGQGADEAVVLLEGPMWCGTGGCSLTIWSQEPDGSYRFVSRSSLCRDEVRVSEQSSHGWTDLVVHVAGGGVAPSWRVLRFDGDAYTLNPSVEPEYDGDPDALTPLDFPARD